MSDFSPSEREMLEMLAEEAGEIVQATMKLLRHGKYAHDVNALGMVKHYDNVENLAHELIDIVAIIRQLALQTDIVTDWKNEAVLHVAWQRKLPYTHRQQEPARPQGICFDVSDSCFYVIETGERIIGEFHNLWYDRRDEFPGRAVAKSEQ
jgi:NTP pyrophosphatase (non-canonical NTP hydrolase)